MSHRAKTLYGRPSRVAKKMASHCQKINFRGTLWFVAKKMKLALTMSKLLQRWEPFGTFWQVGNIEKESTEKWTNRGNLEKNGRKVTTIVGSFLRKRRLKSGKKKHSRNFRFCADTIFSRALHIIWNCSGVRTHEHMSLQSHVVRRWKIKIKI